MHNGIWSRPQLARRLLLLAAFAIVNAAAAAAQTRLGSVRGVVENEKGKPVGGVWLIIDNPELGMNYRKDVNPIGQFVFTEVYPGTYIFRISPATLQIVSPAQIVVKAGQYLNNVKVVVRPAP